jgi:hypothetical protein
MFKVSEVGVTALTEMGLPGCARPFAADVQPSAAPLRCNRRFLIDFRVPAYAGVKI